MNAEVSWSDFVAAHDGACAYCGVPPTDVRLLTRDHLVPQARGGVNALRNIAPACARCNVEKGDLPLLRFLRKRGCAARFVRTRAIALHRLHVRGFDVLEHAEDAREFVVRSQMPDVRDAAALLGQVVLGARMRRNDTLALEAAKEAEREKNRLKAQEKRTRRAAEKDDARRKYEEALLRRARKAGT